MEADKVRDDSKGVANVRERREEEERTLSPRRRTEPGVLRGVLTGVFASESASSESAWGGSFLTMVRPRDAGADPGLFMSDTGGVGTRSWGTTSFAAIVSTVTGTTVTGTKQHKERCLCLSHHCNFKCSSSDVAMKACAVQ